MVGNLELGVVRVALPTSFSDPLQQPYLCFLNFQQRLLQYEYNRVLHQMSWGYSAIGDTGMYFNWTERLQRDKQSMERPLRAGQTYAPDGGL